MFERYVAKVSINKVQGFVITFVKCLKEGRTITKEICLKRDYRDKYDEYVVQYKTLVELVRITDFSIIIIVTKYIITLTLPPIAPIKTAFKNDIYVIFIIFH